MILPKLTTGRIPKSLFDFETISNNKELIVPSEKQHFSSNEVIEEIIKALNNPDNNPKCFVSLASFDGITVSKTLNGGI